MEALTALVVMPLLLANIYAGWEILKFAKKLELPLFGSVDDTPMKLAVLLFANGIVITLLAIIKGK